MPTDPEQPIVPPSQTTGGNEPATESGVDSSAGDDADATTSAGANLPDEEAAEPSIRDAATNAMQTVRDYAKTKAV
jgi:hypothetical protein